jgi:hypothetical protein
MRNREKHLQISRLSSVTCEDTENNEKQIAHKLLIAG